MFPNSPLLKSIDDAKMPYGHGPSTKPPLLPENLRLFCGPSKGPLSGLGETHKERTSPGTRSGTRSSHERELVPLGFFLSPPPSATTPTPHAQLCARHTTSTT